MNRNALTVAMLLLSIFYSCNNAQKQLKNEKHQKYLSTNIELKKFISQNSIVTNWDKSIAQSNPLNPEYHLALEYQIAIDSVLNKNIIVVSPLNDLARTDSSFVISVRDKFELRLFCNKDAANKLLSINHSGGRPVIIYAASITRYYLNPELIAEGNCIGIFPLCNSNIMSVSELPDCINEYIDSLFINNGINCRSINFWGIGLGSNESTSDEE
jgi:hypothetical protein